MKAWVAVAVVVLLAGCQVRGHTSTTQATAEQAGIVARGATDAHAFLHQADFGRLATYPTKTVLHDGAYTWHRVNLSEEHALAAIGSGNLHLTTPAGEDLDVRYERHAEHANGSWTFVGRLRNGQAADEVVLTFGATAAFGTIAQGNGRPALRLMMRNGVSWMVETDPRKLARYQGQMTPEGSTDIAVPEVAQIEQQVHDAGRVRMAALDAQTDAPPVIDLLIGYTPGYVAAMGGEDAAKTRLFHLVELTNQAYLNSDLPGRVRLVGLLPVDYPDKSTNVSALNQLGGVASETNANLDALRAARETYGADLVALVRKFEMDDQQGCGVAWLLGAGQQPITQATGAYGFSVVSDGPFIDAYGNSVWCRDDALAHELGHNLGASHDIATSTHTDGTIEYGAFSYSFGEKTDLSTGNFYTVMTYNNSDQVAYRIFSDPRSTFCGGRACGQANKTDNALGLSQTMPIIASFRTTVVADADLPQPPPPPAPPPAPTPPPPSTTPSTDSGGIHPIAVSCHTQLPVEANPGY